MTTATAEYNKDPLIQSSNQYEYDPIDLGKLLGIMIDGKWLIILITLIFSFFGVAKAFLDSPIYMADALLQVNEQS